MKHSIGTVKVYVQKVYKEHYKKLAFLSIVESQIKKDGNPLKDGLTNEDIELLSWIQQEKIILEKQMEKDKSKSIDSQLSENQKDQIKSLRKKSTKESLPISEIHKRMKEILDTSNRGELTNQCIQDLEKCAEEYPDLGINEFFKTAHTQYDSCRKAVKIIDEEKKSVNISPYKLRDEIKKRERPDIYYRNRKPRK